VELVIELREVCRLLHLISDKKEDVLVRLVYPSREDLLVEFDACLVEKDAAASQAVLVRAKRSRRLVKGCSPEV